MSADRLFLFVGAVFALIAVAAGALGAHALQSTLTPDRLAVFETAVRYQMFHAVALCIVAWAVGRFEGRASQLAGALFALGTLLFSGGLYVYALTGLRAAAMVAPVGGAAFIAGWACLAWLALVAPRRPH
ncbi:MAG TPA: DUF423 domain-containing protein [Burkholderiaceae bacterium]|nr:DUF423 domain-containing protein [Burkholderiaceae bacterium]HRA78604.1 DUF423 domain-containing protein [Burkholderiaceae bacterium]